MSWQQLIILNARPLPQSRGSTVYVQLGILCNFVHFVLEVVLKSMRYLSSSLWEQVLTSFVYSSQRGVTCLHAH
jgi:hypothetical protein